MHLILVLQRREAGNTLNSRAAWCTKLETHSEAVWEGEKIKTRGNLQRKLLLLNITELQLNW